MRSTQIKGIVKMKNSYLNWLVILFVVFGAFTFLSCGDDDDGSNNNHNAKQSPTSIIGTWRNNWGNDAKSYTAYSFFEDGTGLVFDKGNGARRFTYTYNLQTQSLNIDYSEVRQPMDWTIV